MSVPIGLTKEEARRAAEAMTAYGVPEPVLLVMKPWAVATTMMMPKSDTGLFLDRLLYERAIAERVPVAGLETAQEHLPQNQILLSMVQRSRQQDKYRPGIL